MRCVLASFETHLKEELMGEFADVVPSVEVDLPDEEVIAKEMKILLDDGYKSAYDTRRLRGHSSLNSLSIEKVANEVA